MNNVKILVSHASQQFLVHTIRAYEVRQVMVTDQLIYLILSRN